MLDKVFEKEGDGVELTTPNPFRGKIYGVQMLFEVPNNQEFSVQVGLGLEIVGSDEYKWDYVPDITKIYNSGEIERVYAFYMNVKMPDKIRVILKKGRDVRIFATRLVYEEMNPEAKTSVVQESKYPWSDDETLNPYLQVGVGKNVEE